MKKTGFMKVFSEEVMLILNRPVRLIVCIGVPSFLFFLYASIFGDGALNKTIPVALIDEDKTALSRELVRQFQANPKIDIAFDVNSFEEGQKLIRTGKIYAVLLIPDKFEKDINRGKNADVVMFVNNDFLTPGGILNKAFNNTVSSFSASAKVNLVMKSGLNTADAALSVLPVAQDTHTLFNPYINYAYYLCLSLFPMALQLVVMITSLFVLGSVLKYNLGKELYEQSGRQVWNAYWGKILPYTLLYFLMATVMIAYLFYYRGVPVNCPLSTVFFMTYLLVIVYQLMAVFFVSVSKDFRGLCTIGGGYSALAFSFSGYTFPAEGMPFPIKVVDMLFPFASYARLLTNTAVKGMPVSSSAGYLGMLILFGIIGMLSLPKFGGMLQKGKYERK